MARVNKEVEKLRNKAYSAMGKGDYKAARAVLEKMLPLARAEATELMVSLEIGRGDGEAAERELLNMQKLPGERTVYQKLLGARVYFLQKRVVETMREMESIDISKAKPVHREMLYNLLGECYKFLGECDKASEAYLMSSRSSTVQDCAVLEYSNYLFNFHYLRRSISEQRRVAEGYNVFFKDVSQFSHPVPSGEKRKLRIGYISPDLRKHVVLRFSYVLFARYDHERFEVFLYSNSSEDGYSRHLASLVDGWRNISGYAPEKAARLIKEDKIDILVDLAGHTRNNCLPVLAYKPAPIQISGIGYFASTGLKAVDYFLGDVHLDTEEAEEGFTEELLLLPDSHFCYAEMEIAEAGKEPPCKKNGYVTFGSFNNFSKVNDEVLGVWGEILRQLPEARLLLKAEVFDRSDSREIVMRRMEQAGIPLERVETRGHSSDYIGEYRDMDIALDTFPYPGGGTTCDALYMGVPLITLRGMSHGERFGSSILENMGLEELCADTVESYVEKAVGLGRDMELVEALYGNVRTMFRKSPVMNAPLYMKNMEAAYEAVWERYVKG